MCSLKKLTLATFSNNFSNHKTNRIFTTCKTGLTKQSKYLFCTWLDWYFFKLIVLLKPDSNCPSSFTLSWVNEVTTET